MITIKNIREKLNDILYYIEDFNENDKQDIINEINNKLESIKKYIKLNEDFSMSVGAPLGADQGIPNSMDNCAVYAKPIGKPNDLIFNHKHNNRIKPSIMFFPSYPIIRRKRKKKRKTNKTK